MLTIWRGALLNFLIGMFISYAESRENYSNIPRKILKLLQSILTTLKIC